MSVSGGPTGLQMVFNGLKGSEKSFERFQSVLVNFQGVWGMLQKRRGVPEGRRGDPGFFRDLDTVLFEPL